MKVLIFLFFIIPLFNISCAGGSRLKPRDIPYTEDKYHEESLSTMEETVGLIDTLNLKEEPIRDVDLQKIEKTFFKEGTMEDKPIDYLEDAAKEGIEDLSPAFHEEIKALKKEGKKIWHEYLFPKDIEFEEKDR